MSLDGMTQAQLRATAEPHAAPAQADRTNLTSNPFAGAVLVLRSEPAHDRLGRPYLRLTLRTTEGQLLEARWWRYPYPLDRRPRIGQVCHVRGMRDHFAGQLQVRVQTMRHAPDVPIASFVGAALTQPEVLQAELDACIASIGHVDAHLATLVQAVLVDDAVVAERFHLWPAAHTRHGAVRHGLLAHSLRVVALAERLADGYGDTLTIDRGLVTAACLLHDVGKVYTLPEVPGAAFPPAAADADH